MKDQDILFTPGYRALRLGLGVNPILKSLAGSKAASQVNDPPAGSFSPGRSPRLRCQWHPARGFRWSTL